jgi:hypothetical protein
MPPALFRAAADAVVIAHMAFVAFVVLGGLLVWRWRWIAWIHLPAALWGVAIELGGWICPLTPLENSLRRQGGAATYEGDFIERYLLPLLYPTALTREWQYALAAFVLVLNAVIYWGVARTRRSSG